MPYQSRNFLTVERKFLLTIDNTKRWCSYFWGPPILAAKPNSLFNKVRRNNTWFKDFFSITVFDMQPYVIPAKIYL